MEWVAGGKPVPSGRTELVEKSCWAIGTKVSVCGRVVIHEMVATGCDWFHPDVVCHVCIAGCAE